MTHVVKLTAENFKRLVAVEIEPDGRVVTITGRNGEGKTSVLDAITAALAGQRDFKLDKPIRDGEEEAFVEVDLGEFVVTRRWRGDKSQLEVKLASGVPVPQGRKILDDLIGKLSFDPLAFAESDAKDQRRLLLEVAGLTADDAAIQTERQQAYDERTGHNRDAKRLKAQLDGMPKAPKGVEKVDVAAVARELNSLRMDEQEFRTLGQHVQTLDEEKRRLEGRLAELAMMRDEAVAKGRALVDRERPQKIEQLEAQLGDAQRSNELATIAERRDEVRLEYVAAEKASAGCTERIEAADLRRRKLLEAADLPIAGLSVDDDGVLLGGVPFSQASAAERLRTSVAMAMAMNPKLRVIRIEDASLLDSVNRALIEQMAEDSDFQIWLEVVDESRSVGFVIEDGQVVHRG